MLPPKSVDYVIPNAAPVLLDKVHNLSNYHPFTATASAYIPRIKDAPQFDVAAVVPYRETIRQCRPCAVAFFDCRERNTRRRTESAASRATKDRIARY